MENSQGEHVTQVSHAAARARRFPLMERPGAALLLAVIGGLLNAWAFAQTQSFGTAQTGNVVMIGYRLMQGDTTALLQVTGSVLAFGLGTMVAGVIIGFLIKANKRVVPPLEGLIIALLVISFLLVRIPNIDHHHVAWVIAFAGGVQANTFPVVEGVPYSSVGMTGGVTQAFVHLSDALFSKASSGGTSNLRIFALHALAILGFAAGGAFGFLSDQWFEGLSLVFALIASIGVLLIALTDRKDPDPVRPDDGHQGH